MRKTPSNYAGPEDCEATWLSLSADKPGGSSFGSLVKLAKDGGYTGPVRYEPSLLQRFAHVRAEDYPPATTANDDPSTDEPATDVRSARVQKYFDSQITLKQGLAFEPAPWLVDDVFYDTAEGQSGWLIGATGSGKTFTYADAALGFAAVAAGIEGEGSTKCLALGKKVHRGGIVVMCCGENAHDLASTRVRAALTERGFSPEEIEAMEPYWYVQPIAPKLLDNQERQDFCDYLATLSERVGLPVMLVVIDTLAKAAPGQREDPQLFSLWDEVMADIRATTKGLVLTVHHTPTDDHGRPRGGDSPIANCSVALLAMDAGGDNIDLHVIKQQIGPQPEKPLRFTLARRHQSRVLIPRSPDAPDAAAAKELRDELVTARQARILAEGRRHYFAAALVALRGSKSWLNTTPTVARKMNELATADVKAAEAEDAPAEHATKISSASIKTLTEWIKAVWKPLDERTPDEPKAPFEPLVAACRFEGGQYGHGYEDRNEVAEAYLAEEAAKLAQAPEDI